MSAPTRIDDELFRHAQAVSASRVSHQDLANVLAARQSYGDLDDDYTQAAVRVAWQERHRGPPPGLNLAEAFAAEGRRSWVVAEDDGNPVEITTG